MIEKIILILIILIGIIITIPFIIKSIKRQEWGQLALEIGALVNALILIFLIL
jgi:hypothetical protein